MNRQDSGIVHAILNSSTHPVLWRPVAGLIRTTVVVTLPGDAKLLKKSLTTLLVGSLSRVLHVIKNNLTSESVAEEVEENRAQSINELSALISEGLSCETD